MSGEFGQLGFGSAGPRLEGTFRVRLFLLITSAPPPPVLRKS